MNLALIDWLIIAGMLSVLGVVALITRRYTRSVSDFLAGNRCAGRYLLTLSEGMTALGLAGVVASFEKFYEAGFAASWWGTMMTPIAMIIALSGWVNYRYRQTRAMTMAQFFEMRYSRSFRIFAGIVGWISGVLNFGVFPGITARFLIYFCGLPSHLDVMGLVIPTLAPVMLIMLALTLLLTLAGGMVTVMICDFLQAQFVNVVFLLVMIALLVKFSWGEVSQSLINTEPGHSLINPFDQQKIADFNLWFFLIFAFKLFYNRLGWQGTQGYNCAAKSPHEAKMAGILAEWRGGVTYLMISLMPICAYVLLHHPNHAAEAAVVRDTLATIADPQTQKQVTVPIALVHMLPMGVVGFFCAAMIAATIGNDTTYLHAWGSIFIQDVVLPIRNRTMTPEQHIRWLRFSVLGVAIFSFTFSLIFPLREYVIMYLLVTGAIYLAGSGSAIIGGLYWSRGTTQGAWAGMVTGVVLASGAAILRVVWPWVPALVAFKPQFPLNGAWMALIASLSSVIAYVCVSLLTARQPFNMDKLLHRGPYALPESAPTTHVSATVPWWDRAIGITAECTRGDRIIYRLKVGWTSFWVLTFVAGTAWGLFLPISNETWMNWWLFSVSIGAVVGVITIIWFLWGGTIDLVDLLRFLRTAERDVSDNGMVVQPAATGHGNALAAEPQAVK